MAQQPENNPSQSLREAVKVFAPISIGNVSVGFDTLGMAVSPIDGQLVGDIISVKSSASDQDRLECSGSFQQFLPKQKEANIIWQCLQEFNQVYSQQNGKPETVEIHLEKNTPICSGLGSSACSVVAGLYGLNEFYGRPLSQQKLLELMGELEAKISGSLHFDNVAPSYLGGLQLMVPESEEISQTIPVFDEVYWVVCYPDVEVSTRFAREILPEEYSRQVLVTYGGRLAGFIDACHRQDKARAFSLVKDIVAEPYRTTLLTNFKQTKAELESIGARAVGISGSGPTVFAVYDSLEQAEQAKLIFAKSYIQSKSGFTIIGKTDTKGARRI
jgi:homoserine kinase